MRREIERLIATTLLALTLTLVIGGVFTNVSAQCYEQMPCYNFDFTVVTSRTLIKIQQGQTGALSVWVNLFCPNSTADYRCDPTISQTVYLSVSGCPSGALCLLDRQVVILWPHRPGVFQGYQASSNLIIYTFFGITASTSPTLMSVTGVDQFGHTHSATFGVVVCNC